MRLLFPVFFLVFSFSVSAKKFATSYVSFDLLNNWHCHPEGTEWICTNKLNRKKASEAMIILTAKQKGPPDSLAQYINHLKSPRVSKSSRGRSFTSKVFHTKQRNINQHMWVDGFHQGSEVPAYYTRYLVTTKGSLAILVTYSAHKNHYKKYASDFAASINSLRVMNVSPDFASKQKGSIGMGSMQDYLQDMIDADDELGMEGNEDGLGGKGGLLGLLLQPEALGMLALAGAGLGYLLLKRRKKRRLRAVRADEKSRSSKRGRRSGRSSSDRSRRRSSRSSSEREKRRSSSRSSRRRR